MVKEQSKQKFQRHMHAKKTAHLPVTRTSTKTSVKSVVDLLARNMKHRDYYKQGM
jgi:hypothetical protein